MADGLSMKTSLKKKTVFLSTHDAGRKAQEQNNLHREIGDRAVDDTAVASDDQYQVSYIVGE